jgi:subtilisin family serine protease
MRYTRLQRAVSITSPLLLLALAVNTATAQAQTSQAAVSSRVMLTPSQAQALSRNVTDKVIVVLKNQVSNLPDTPVFSARRAASVKQSQQGVMSVLTATHAGDVKSISVVNAVAATVSSGTAQLLAANSDVAAVIPDLPIPVATSPAVHASAAQSLTPLPGACAPSGQVQLDPEAIEAIHAAEAPGQGPSAQALGYTGAGVKVAFIADGVDPDNPDFIRANGQHVFIDYQDFSGTGTNAPSNGDEAFLDSSSIAAQGRVTYNVASFAGLSEPCLIRILGVAPGSSLVGLNVFGSANVAFNSVFLEAIDYAVTVDHVNVLNESFGDNPFPDVASLDLIKMANDAAVSAGVTVDVSSGDAGPTNTIGSPATDPNVISAGATTTYRAYAQTGIGGITAPGVKGWLDNNISGLSSGGFGQTGGTVDVVAPGDLNWALCTPDTALFSACANFSGQASSVELSGGTSEAAPLTSGTAALVIQAYREAHGGATPSPAVVKQIIVSTAENIDAPGDQQGAGMIDAYQAVLAARSYDGSTAKPSGQAILDSATQLNAVGQAGTTEHFGETLTNDGAARVTVGLSSRTLSPYTPVSTQSLSLTDAGGYATEVSFTVPRGQARLSASVALVGLVNLSLISPDGDLAEYNLPQGTGNYGNAQVADPAPGKWTALISTSGSGTAVPAQFQASTATWQPFGSLSAHSLTLSPGTSGTVTLTVRTPSQPGDEAGTILLTSSAASPAFAAVTSVPVTLRSLVPAPHPSTTVSGILTGGNGRESNTGQTAYYQVQIPAGLKALNASISTGNAGNTLFAELVDPSGGAASAAANGLMTTTSSGTTEVRPEAGTQLHVLDPAAGLWTVIVDFYNTVSGTAVSQPFTITIDDTPVTVSARGLPDSASTKLAAGKPVTAWVSVHNGGTAPEAYFVDARLSSQATVNLAPQTTPTLTLPNVTGVIPTFLVPSHTTTVQATVSSPASLYFDLSYPFGDPDLLSSTGTTATDSYTAPDIPPGNWTVTPFLVGPTGTNPAPNVTASVSATATTAAFDSAVSAPTGDLWLGSTNATTGFTPYVVNPGQSVTIPVTITPDGSPGSTVSGTVYLADSSLVSGAVTYNELSGNYPEGSDLAAFAYSYTIK